MQHEVGAQTTLPWQQQQQQQKGQQSAGAQAQATLEQQRAALEQGAQTTTDWHQLQQMLPGAHLLAKRAALNSAAAGDSLGSTMANTRAGTPRPDSMQALLRARLGETVGVADSGLTTPSDSVAASLAASLAGRASWGSPDWFENGVGGDSNSRATTAVGLRRLASAVAQLRQLQGGGPDAATPWSGSGRVPGGAVQASGWQSNPAARSLNTTAGSLAGSEEYGGRDGTLVSGAAQASGWQSNPAAASLNATAEAPAGADKRGTAVGLRRLSYALQGLLQQQQASQQRQAQREMLRSQGSLTALQQASLQASPRLPSSPAAESPAPVPLSAPASPAASAPAPLPQSAPSSPQPQPLQQPASVPGSPLPQRVQQLQAQEGSPKPKPKPQAKPASPTSPQLQRPQASQPASPQRKQSPQAKPWF